MTSLSLVPNSPIAPGVDSGTLTTKGDLITFDTAPNRLPVGTDGQVLVADSAQSLGLKWQAAPPAQVATDTIFTAKGAMAVGTGSHTAGTLTVGTDGQVLTADSTQTTGTKWATPASGLSTDSLWTTKGQIVAATGSAAASAVSVGTNGQVLTADSSQATGIKWATPSGLAMDTLWVAKGDLVAATGAATAIRLALGTNGQVLTADSTATAGVKWASAPSGSVASDAIFTAKGDLPVGTGSSAAAKLAVGTNNQVLTADSTQTTGAKWATPKTVATDGLWTAKGQIAAATGSGAASALTVGSNGQVLTADSSQTTGLKWAAAASLSLPWYDVALAPYNAVLDGVTDCYTAITSALADASAAGGGVVLVKGQAATSAEIVVGNNCGISGGIANYGSYRLGSGTFNGPFSIVPTSGASGLNSVVNLSGQGSFLSHIGISGNNQARAAIVTSTSYGATIQNVFAAYGTEYCVWVQAQDTWISECKFIQDDRGSGLFVDDAGSNGAAPDCRFNSIHVSGGNGIYGNVYSRTSNNVFEAVHIYPGSTSSEKTVTGAVDNAAGGPIKLTAVGHGFANGQTVYVRAVGGNTAANYTWTVANKTTDTLQLVSLQYGDTQAAASTTASGSSGLNSSTVTVASTSGFNPQGRFVIGGVKTTYTGLTSTAFTGCGNHVALTGGEAITADQTCVSNLLDTTWLLAGAGISGTGIPGGTTISSVDSGSLITLSANATATSAQGVTGQGGNLLTINSLTNSAYTSGGKVALAGSYTGFHIVDCAYNRIQGGSYVDGEKHPNMTDILIRATGNNTSRRHTIVGSQFHNDNDTTVYTSALGAGNGAKTGIELRCCSKDAVISGISVDTVDASGSSATNCEFHEFMLFTPGSGNIYNTHVNNCTGRYVTTPYTGGVPDAGLGTNTWYTGTEISGVPQAEKYDARVTADVPITGDTSMHNITSMSFKIGAGEVWTGEFELVATGSTNGFQVDVNGPASPTDVRIVVHGDTSAVTAARTDTMTAFATANGTALCTGSITGMVRITVCVTNGTTAGTVQARFKCANSGDTNTILKDSFMKARRIA